MMTFVGSRIPTLKFPTAPGDLVADTAGLREATWGRSNIDWELSEGASRSAGEVTRLTLNPPLLGSSKRLDAIVGETVPDESSFIQMKDNIFHPVCSSEFILSVLHPLPHPPTLLAIKRPSPDWNVRNADVTALDKLVVTMLSWMHGKGQRQRVRDQEEGCTGNLKASQLGDKVTAVETQRWIMAWVTSSLYLS